MDSTIDKYLFIPVLFSYFPVVVIYFCYYNLLFQSRNRQEEVASTF